MVAFETFSETLPTSLQTVEEFEAWERLHAHEGSFEFVAGRIIPKESVKQNEQRIIRFLNRLFIKTKAFAVGDELFQEMDSYVDGTRKQVPDLAYFNNEQITNSGNGVRNSTVFPIEILSDSESYEDVDDKIQDYFDAGAAFVWYIAPKRQRIYVYTAPGESKAYAGADVISAAPILPDFSFIVSDLFAA
jgi:Uma2 family endonuclease